jgi:threonine/homoserine/homoserine lactone efflux protein
VSARTIHALAPERDGGRVAGGRGKIDCPGGAETLAIKSNSAVEIPRGRAYGAPAELLSQGPSMSLAVLIAFGLAFAVAAASPGPGMAAVVARGLGGGFKGAFPMVLGLILGDLLYLSFAAFGLAAIAQSFGALFLVIKYAGAAYLLYLAYRLWTGTPDPEGIRARASEHWARTVLSGLSVTLGNPKTMVFYLALLPTLVPLERITMLEFAELAVTMMVLLALIGSAYAAAAAGAREMLRSPRALRRLNRSAGAVMAGAAAAVIAR